LLRQAPHWLEKTQTQVFLRCPRHHLLQRRRVLGLNWTDEYLAAIAQEHGTLEILGIGTDRQSGLGRAFGARDANPRVQRQHSLGIGQQRVDVEVNNLGEVSSKLSHLHQRQSHRVQIRRRLIAIATQQAVDARTLDQRAGKKRVQRRQRHRRIADLLDRDATLAEQHDRAELGILADPDDQFVRAVPAHHLLDDHPVDDGLRRGLARPVENFPGRRAHRFRRVEIEHHAADVALVDDIGRDDLDHKRARYPTRGRSRGIGVGRHGEFADRHAVGLQHRLRHGLGQPASAGFERLVDQGADRRGVRLELLRHGRRHLHQKFLVQIVTHHVHEGANRLFWRVVAGNAAVYECLARRR
jgi:hypothetical protein